MDPVQGRGWAVVKGDELHGMIFFHGGDDSEFVAKWASYLRNQQRRGGESRRHISPSDEPKCLCRGPRPHLPFGIFAFLLRT